MFTVEHTLKNFGLRKNCINARRFLSFFLMLILHSICLLDEHGSGEGGEMLNEEINKKKTQTCLWCVVTIRKRGGKTFIGD